MATTITVGRATRDVLRRELIGELDQHYEALQSALRRDPSEARRLRVQADREAELLDALGWADDDERSRYELRANRALAAWLKRVRTSVKEFAAVGETCSELESELNLIDRLRGQLGELIGAVA
jgi:hypothetical protein